MHRIGVDPGGVASMAAKMQTHCIHLPRMQCRQANILKQEMLALGGDAAVARGSVACSIDSTDVILIGTFKQLKRLCLKLAQQPFGLPVLSTELSALLARIPSTPTVWQTARRDLQLTRPLLMGILNVTPDSFSDGGCYLSPHQAVERARQLIDEGADIIDVGGESTRPGADAVSVEEETARVVPVISELARTTDCAISIDTWKSAVARNAMACGAEIINDISGLTFDGDMTATAAATGAGVILMHTRGTPGTMQQNTEYADLIAEVTQGLRESVNTALSAGIGRERIVIDPGIGFAKDCRGNLELLRRLREFNSLGLPLLIGTSRKSFIGTVTGRDINNRQFGTAATVALAISHGARILRVHDVRAMRDVAVMAHAITKEYNV